MTFEMANAMGERRYDWGSKIVVALNPNELSAIVTDPRKEHTFYHDTCEQAAGWAGRPGQSHAWLQQGEMGACMHGMVCCVMC